MSQQMRGYSVLHVKALDGASRTIRGTASTPELDRQGDIVEPLGVQFHNPMPLLLHHDATRPVGLVSFSTPTTKGIDFEASFPIVEGSAVLQARIDEAWASIRAGLIPAVSIGFRALADGVEPLKSGGLRFTKSEVLELSLVTIPANSSALISSIKALDTLPVAAVGPNTEGHTNTPGASGTPVVKVLPSRQERQMKTSSEQIAAFEATRAAKAARLSDIQTKAGDEGRTKDASEKEEFSTLRDEIKSLDEELVDLREMESMQKSAAVPVAGNSQVAAHTSRGGEYTPIIRVQTHEEKGIGFAKAVLCKAAAFLSHGSASAVEFAKARFPDDHRLQVHLKAAVPAGTTTGVTWAAPFVDPVNLASEFIEFLRPMTILGKFGTNGIPSLRRVPFNVRILGQTSGGDAYWVAEGAPKPVTKFDFNATTLLAHKVATIAVITKELARFSVPGAERIVRDSLAQAVTARIDIDLIDPTQAAVTGVNPASLTNGVTPLAPSGVTADAARSDIARVIKQYLDNNNNVASLVLIMPASLALSLSAMRNTLGQREFSDMTINGGTFEGIPVITSQYAANQSGAGNLVIAVNASDVLLADDGNVTVEASDQASLQMLDNPTNSSATATATTMVSMFQTNSIALLAEREITWAKARSTAVVYMDDVNWGSIGSPA
jgi:HK97 family phage major capsid protein